ncbi:MAG TPA: hypothetical protein VFC86_09635 [Planctomycetota bacterium]|nr:hypothetical protein [Planctomycetota bacterium]
MNDKPARPSRITAWPSTAWSAIRAIQSASPDERRAALEDLLRVYYEPVHRFFLKALGIRGPRLDDVTQEFFTRFIEKDFLKNVTYEKSFRGFLKLACRRHYINWCHAEKSARARSGDMPRLNDREGSPIDIPIPEERFNSMVDEELRRMYLDEAVERTRNELVRQGKELYFRIFEARCAQDGSGIPDYETLSRQFKIPLFDICNHLMAARKIFRASLQAFAIERSEDPREELRELGLDRHIF